MKRIRSLLPIFSILSVFWISGCAVPRQLVTDPAPAPRAGDSEALPAIYAPKPVSVLLGKASYYWEPQRTASGERFNPKQMTAAHKSLPMHSVVRVVNLKNGKSVIVRINDRGPYIRGRIIDLSKVAAQKIDMVKAGVVPVRVEVLKKIDVIKKPNRKVKRAH
ncbi:MAG: septal ring lytic transglycosylase RlpA family protein [Terrimicrobiaceae bacterium]